MSFVESLESRQFFAAGPTAVFSYGNSGLNTVTFRSDNPGDRAVPLKTLVDSGGRAYVVAYAGGAVQVKRLTQIGSADDTYANARGLIGLPVSDKLTLGRNAGGIDAVIDSADRLYVLAGNQVFRFTTSGKIDKTYGTNGVATLGGFAGAKALAVGAGDKLYVAGSLAAGTGVDATGTGGRPLYQFAVARLRTAGVYDKTFASKGVYAVPLPGNAQSTDRYSRGQAIQITADGSVYAASVTRYKFFDDNEPFVVTGTQSIKLDVAGAPVTSYGTNGVSRFYSVSGDISFATASFNGILDDGSVVAFYYGSSDSPQDDSYSRYARIKPDGTVENNYDINAAAGHVPDKLVAVDANTTRLVSSASTKKPLNVNVTRLFSGEKPIADLAAKPVKAVTSRAKFTIAYRSPTKFLSGYTLGGSGTVSVIKPDGTVLHPTADASNGADLYVVYTLRDADGQFTAADNGVYTVRVDSGAVVDAEGNVANAARTLGTLTISIA